MKRDTVLGSIHVNPDIWVSYLALKSPHTGIFDLFLFAFTKKKEKSPWAQLHNALGTAAAAQAQVGAIT